MAHSTPPSDANAPQELKFALFPKLPKELQIKIWKFAEFNHVREVELQIDLPTSPSDAAPVTFHFKLLTPIPPTLHICRESRAESLKRYLPCHLAPIVSSNMSREEIEENIAPIYLNPFTDALCIEFVGWFETDIGLTIVSVIWFVLNVRKFRLGGWEFGGSVTPNLNVITIRPEERISNKADNESNTQRTVGEDRKNEIIALSNFYMLWLALVQRLSADSTIRLFQIGQIMGR